MKSGKLSGRTGRLVRSIAIPAALVALLGGLLPAIMGATANAAPTPAAPTTNVSIASENPGTGAPAATIAASAIDVCVKVAAKAGFSFTSMKSTALGNERYIAVAVAIAMAESSCNPSATNTNTDGSEDRGLWQINNVYHSEVSNACAFQIQCNADAAWNISSHGSDWSPWSTWNNGAWENYIGAANSAVSGFSFQLEDLGDGTCLDADQANHNNGGPIFQWSCNSGDIYQQWTVVVPSVGHNPVLKNVGTGTCLDADGASKANGAKIFQWACNGGDNAQVWWFNGSGQLNTDGNANAGLQNTQNGTCLDADGTSKGNGAPIFQWACNHSDSFQEWN